MNVRKLWREKRKEVVLLADNAEKARELTIKLFSRASDITLYQLLKKDELPEFSGEEFNRSWSLEPNVGWLRTIPGKRLPLFEAPDELTDKELTEKYLATLS